MAIQKTVPPPQPRLPDPTTVDFTDPAKTREFMAQMVSSVAKELNARGADTTPKGERLFTAPDGSIYRMSVDNAGAPVFVKTDIIRGNVPHV